MDRQLNRRNSVDPAVADMLQDMERRRKLSQLPKAKQNQARRNAARHKVGLDLPPELHERLRLQAEKERISISSLVAFYLYRALADEQVSQLDLGPYKRLSRCARFEYVLDFAKLDHS